MQDVFPIRTNRTEWKIPLFCFHTCSEVHCSHRMTIDTESPIPRVLFLPNPNYSDGTCSHNGNIYPTKIHLLSYDMSKPKGSMGDLCEPDMIVIPDNEFDIHITYPLSVISTIHVINKEPTTIREILQIIKDSYINIYRVEEETASSTVFHMSRKCDMCTRKSSKECLAAVEYDKTTDSMCSICYSNYQPTDTIVKCPCDHQFHSHCICKWIDQGIDSDKEKDCPMCRTRIQKCNRCENKGVIEYRYEGVVLPTSMRTTPQRNRTDGIYGISDIDFENLEISSLIYKRIKKTLYLIMTQY